MATYSGYTCGTPINSGPCDFVCRFCKKVCFGTSKSEAPFAKLTAIRKWAINSAFMVWCEDDWMLISEGNKLTLERCFMHSLPRLYAGSSGPTKWPLASNGASFLWSEHLVLFWQCNKIWARPPCPRPVFPPTLIYRRWYTSSSFSPPSLSLF